MGSHQVSAVFTVDSWDEAPFDEEAGLAKLSRAAVEKSYSGDIVGSSATVWLMAYADDGTAGFVGLERVRATVAGRTGSFVLQHVGRFEGGAAKAALEVVAGSGTGDLGGLSGEGTFLADPNGSVDLDLTFG